MSGPKRRRVVVLPGKFQAAPIPTKKPRIEEPSKEKTPPPPETQDEEVQQKTPPPRQLAETHEVQSMNLTPPPSPRHVAEPFVDEVQKEADALIVHPEDDDVQTLGEEPKEFNAEGPKETENKIQDAKNFDMPLTSVGNSFKTFQFVETGFESAPLLVVPDPARNALQSHRASAIEFFGDLSGLSDLEKANIWSLRAVAGVSEPFVKVPDPFAENQRLLMPIITITWLWR